ncbi:MAG: GEVED domain-containing protein, partial [bacterium]
GIVIDDACPPPASGCLGYATSYSAAPMTIPNIALTAGTSYYIMVDTYPSPNCVPDFDIILSVGAGGPPNDMCADAEPLGNVTDYPFTTTGASFDGPGGCLTSGNVWYTYTATCDGDVTVDLCGSGFDTKLAVYEGTACWGTMVGCNDDACGLQSSLTFAALTGEEFLIEVGGYGTASGDGDITIDCYVPPPPPYNDECQNAIVQSCPAVITGTNESSTNEAPDCLDDCGHAWEAFEITATQDVTITLCGTSPSFDLVYISLYDECPVGAGCTYILADATDWDACGDGNVTMYFYALPAGIYYLPMLACYPGYESYYMEGPYTVNIDCQDPSYCAASGGCDEYISNVLLESINNASGCDGYGDYLALSTVLEPGGTYPMAVTIGNAYSSDQTAAWIDFDHSMTFDAEEEVLFGTGTGPILGDVYVPTDALLGETRMRVRLTWNAVPTPCGATSYGEAEDYTIDIQCFPAGAEAQVSVDPMYMYYAFQIDPYMIDVYLDPTQWDPYHTVPYIDLSSIQVNGYPVPAVVGGPVFGYSCGPTIYCNMWLYNFIAPYGAPLGFNPQTFNVTGDFTTSGSWLAQGEVGLYGKDPYRPAMWIVPPDEIILRADCDRSGFVNISDATYLIQFIFNTGEAPLPRMVADADCNLMVNVTDAVYLINFIFAGGPQPCPAGD